ncbi:lysosomal Pro-X carboxypeptidase isoform X2 [Rosa chinensis]|uniref:lysosomal Pro-X carboxypeptidase isoform X2 n=1 Tax=Rosa chinensis TaxID=74649 RepID=UPI001AD8A0E8|nr:lysosomal Pro-X carboxypeptidase isoform X2 [Rosa chinensis]
MKKMTESRSPFLFWFSFFCLLHSLPVHSAKSSHRRFPSLLISPGEKISPSAGQNQLYRTKYFTQVLDHFNYYPKSNETFQQRYLINDTFWGGAKSNAPIFVYTGNEGNIEWFAENTGFLYDTAPHFKALIIFIEADLVRGPEVGTRASGARLWPDLLTKPRLGVDWFDEGRTTTKGVWLSDDDGGNWSRSSTRDRGIVLEYWDMVWHASAGLGGWRCDGGRFGVDHGSDHDVGGGGDDQAGSNSARHRFYGKSLPFGGKKDVAYSNASTLGYLSSTQALADYASLIIDLKKNLTGTDSPVVVFGGSYGGMLAAWFRLKYPHVTIGALASSSPILNFENITSPDSFNNIVTKDFRSESESCYRVIKGSWENIKDTAKQPGGLELLRKSFKICTNNISVDDLQNWLETAYLYTAMTDYPTPSNFMSPMPAYPVKQMCKAIDDPTTGNDTFAKLYGAATVYYNYSGTAKCFDLNDKSDPHDLGGWDWQACTEMIMQTDGNNEESMFPPSEWQYKDQVSYCEETYGVEPRPTWITTEFGGHDIKRVLRRFGSNIIFFNGLRDPWSGGGVLTNISKRIVAIVAKEGAHHVDLRFKTSEDPEWLNDVRKQEIKIIAKWISEYYHDLADKH